MALRFFTCFVLTVCIVASVDATISCGTVVTSLAPCATYFSKGGEVPSSSCCNGVRYVNDMAQTTTDRQQTCRCIQSFAKNIPDLDQSLATGLPKKCGVETPYTITMDTNCDDIKYGLISTISCGTVVTSLAPCAPYFSKSGEVPSLSCCDGVRNVNDMAQTTTDRQQTCRCIQSFAKSIPGLDQSLATGLPKKCGVETPYSITMDTNCNDIKYGLAEI